MSEIQKNKNEQRRYMNETQAADYLGISTKTLQRFRCTGMGPVFGKIGARVLYDIVDCDEWVSERKVRNTIQGVTIRS